MKKLGTVMLTAAAILAFAAAPTNAEATNPAKTCDVNDHTNAHATKPYLGVSITALHPAIAHQLQGLMPDGVGIMVSEVMPDSPATAADLRSYDVLTKLGDQHLYSSEQFVKMIRHAKIGDPMTLSYIRNGQMSETDFILAPMPTTGANVAHEEHGVHHLHSLARNWMSSMLYPNLLTSLMAAEGCPLVDYPLADCPMSEECDLSDASSCSHATCSATTMKALSLNRDSDGNVSLHVDYREGDKLICREFAGTCDEVCAAIRADDALSDDQKESLLERMKSKTANQCDDRLTQKWHPPLKR